jgi:hypothetical protein
MQMQAVMWSSVSGELGNLFDTQDWNVYGGRITAERAVSEWNTFLCVLSLAVCFLSFL